MDDVYYEEQNSNFFVKYGPVIFYTLIQIGVLIAVYIVYNTIATIWSLIGVLFWLIILFLLCYYNHYYIAWFLIFLPLIIFLVSYFITQFDKL